MNTPDGGGLPGHTGAEPRASPDAGPSYGDVSSLPAGPSVCEWRTAEFHDQECLRFFDCPSHIVARRLPDDDEEDDNEGEGATAADDTQEGIEGEQQQQGEDVDESVFQHESEESPLLAHHSSDGTADAVDISSDSSSALSSSDGDHNNRGMMDDVHVPALLELNDDTREDDLYRPASSGTREHPIVLGDSPVRERRQTLQGPQAQSRGEEEAIHRFPPFDSPGDRAPSSSVPINQLLDTALPATLSGLETMSLGTTPSPSHGFPPVQSGSIERTSPVEIVLPRWQPDSEVTYCPICHTQFSIFVRKHHCR